MYPLFFCCNLQAPIGSLLLVIIWAVTFFCHVGVTLKSIKDRIPATEKNKIVNLNLNSLTDKYLLLIFGNGTSKRQFVFFSSFVAYSVLEKSNLYFTLKVKIDTCEMLSKWYFTEVSNHFSFHEMLSILLCFFIKKYLLLLFFWSCFF